MKKIMIISTLILLGTSPVFAGNLAPKSPVHPPYNADRVTVFNKLTDSISTLGQPDQQKQMIQRERKIERKQKRLNQETQRKNAKSQRQIKGQQKIIMNKVNAENQARMKRLTSQK